LNFHTQQQTITSSPSGTTFKASTFSWCFFVFY